MMNVALQLCSRTYLKRQIIEELNLNILNSKHGDMYLILIIWSKKMNIGATFALRGAVQSYLPSIDKITK
jgi:hypothetical protein